MTDLLKENVTENINNGTTKTASSFEGLAVAYGSLVIMALLPILCGSLRSLKHVNDRGMEVFLEKSFFSVLKVLVLNNSIKVHSF